MQERENHLYCEQLLAQHVSVGGVKRTLPLQIEKDNEVNHP